MRILTLYQGLYGKRIVENIRKSMPHDWIIDDYNPPAPLPIIVDDPTEYLPLTIPQADLLLALGESPRTAQLVPAIVQLSGAKAVVMPIDNSSWLPLGLKNQIEREIAGMGVASVFPKTFCTLTERTTGFGANCETYENPCIAAFATYFGKPKLKITKDSQNEKITGIKVQRSAPCGSTHRVAEKLMGVAIEEAVPQASLHVFHYPCLASMEKDATGYTLMHISGYVVNVEVHWELQPYSTPWANHSTSCDNDYGFLTPG